MPPILHIPHSSIYFPNKEGFVIDKPTLDAEVNKLTDWYTEDLFDLDGVIKVIAPFSRIFCDVERFADDSMEEMAAKGAGVCYTRLDTGEEMRRVTTELKEFILHDYYYPHHQRLEQAVDEQLQQHGKAFIIDGHSFSNIPFVRDTDQHSGRPDINIGTDPFHTPEKLIEKTAQHFKTHGFSVEMNRPYSGTMVPLKYYLENANVHSIMIEVNRRLYLDENGNRKENKLNYLNQIITELIKTV